MHDWTRFQLLEVELSTKTLRWIEGKLAWVERTKTYRSLIWVRMLPKIVSILSKWIFLVPWSDFGPSTHCFDNFRVVGNIRGTWCRKSIYVFLFKIFISLWYIFIFSLSYFLHIIIFSSETINISMIYLTLKYNFK